MLYHLWRYVHFHPWQEVKAVEKIIEVSVPQVEKKQWKLLVWMVDPRNRDPLNSAKSSSCQLQWEESCVVWFSIWWDTRVGRLPQDTVLVYGALHQVLFIVCNYLSRISCNCMVLQLKYRYLTLYKCFLFGWQKVITGWALYPGVLFRIHKTP